MMPFDAYRCYLSMKNHFTKDKYDYHKYCGKSRATVQSFYKRKDRFWFEKFARSKSDKEVEEFFISNFITCTDPSKLWIGEMIRNGESRYTEWKKRTQSLSYLFKEESESVFADNDFDAMFSMDDKKLTDPVWESVSMKMKKYSPFLNINVPRYKKILKEVIIHGT